MAFTGYSGAGRPRNVETEVELHFGEGKSVRYRRQVVMLYENQKVRDAVAHVVRPALRPGIDRIGRQEWRRRLNPIGCET